MQHALVGLIGNDSLYQLALARARFRSQNMTRIGVMTHNFAGTGLLKTLRGTLVGFHLGHNSVLISCEFGILKAAGQLRNGSSRTGTLRGMEQLVEF
jgi:hypothetical protein